MKYPNTSANSRCYSTKRSERPEPTIRAGYVDFIAGIELIGNDVLELLQALESDKKEMELEKDRYANIRRNEEETRKGKKEDWFQNIPLAKAVDRHNWHRVTLSVSRTLK